MNSEPMVDRWQARLDQLNSRSNPAELELKEVLESALKLAERFDKVIAISDRYQSELHEASQKLEQLARKDYLTNLSNRHDMVERLETELARCLRHDASLSVILFDVDQFKTVNDQWGHEAGDRTLTAVAATLKSLTRRSDTCSRWGGEEFLILCPETDATEALLVAEKCRKGVEELMVSGTSSPIKVTVSGGIGTLSGQTQTWSSILAQADEAMYRAKTMGRNQVIGLTVKP